METTEEVRGKYSELDETAQCWSYPPGAEREPVLDVVGVNPDKEALPELSPGGLVDIVRHIRGVAREAEYHHHQAEILPKDSNRYHVRTAERYDQKIRDAAFILDTILPIGGSGWSDRLKPKDEE